MTLISDRDFDTTWGITAKTDAHPKTILGAEEACTQACAKIAKRYGLTSREEEILALLARGYTLSRAAQALYVADSTMKTHSRHIYRKVGVSNRGELQEFVESQC